MSKFLLSRSTLALSFAIVFIVLLSHSVSLQGAAAPSADFDGSRGVNITDFLLFTSVFGTREGQEQYEAKYDLNSDGEIGITDFLIFANSFGKKVEQTVNSEPRFTFVSLAIRSFDDSTSAGQDIGDPVSAIDPDGDSLTYRLSGPDANSFTIISSSGQLQTKAGVTYNYKTKPVYSVIVGAADSRGGTDAVTVRIAVLSPNLSGTYQNFVRAKENETEPVLPDFSYSGYHYFNKPVPNVTHPIFDVTTYGAIPNDNISDQPAIKAAIAAAESNGSGIVFFPPGVFLVNTDTDKNSEGKNESIYIRSSNIVLRGSGSRQGGTIIRQVNHLPPTNPDQLWTSPFMFYFKPNDIRYRTLTKITESAERETFWITVADASKLKVGQRIRIYMKSTQAIKEFLAPRSPEPNWSKLLSEGITIDEEHSIAEIQGNRIRFNEPLHTRVNHAHGWVVRSYPYIEEVGVEDISFRGSFFESFIHHKSALHDGGWSLLMLHHCVNSWIRRVSFMHVNHGISIVASAAVSVYQVTIAGNKGHYAIKSQSCYGTWFGLSEDIAGQAPYSTVPFINGPNNTHAIPGQHHGVGMSHSSTGNVIYRFDMAPKQPLDIHKTDPCYANLYDCVNNGRLSGSSGGGVPPHHLRRLMFWNFNHGGEDTHYDFWQGYLRFVNPIIVGFHGNPATFNKNVLEVLESNGATVDPESLFQAQLELRLGAVPTWYNNLHTEWQTLRKIPLLIPANKAPVANAKIYWSDNGTDKIQRANLDGSGVEDLVMRPTLNAPVGIALDLSGGKMYWVDENTDKIQRASIELGQGETTRTVESLVTTGLDLPSGITLDLSDGKMYWVDRGTDKVQRANLDGSNVEDVLTTGLNAPSGITLDLSRGKMCWVDRGTDKVQRANLDGSNVEDLVTGVTDPRGIALDTSGGKMYWVDNGADKIQRANLDGSNVEDLVTGVTEPRGIALDLSGGKMYWVDNSADKVQRANLDGSNVEDVLTTGLTTPVSIVLDVIPSQILAVGTDRPIDVSSYFSDPDGDKLTYSALSSDMDIATVSVMDSVVTISPVSSGRATVTVTANDGYSSVQQNLTITVNSKIYWSDNGTDKIQRSNFDGSSVEDLLMRPTLNAPVGIALDVSGGKMYWVDENTDKIQRSNLDGTGVEDLIATGLDLPSGIALDISGSKMYWMDRGTDKIQRSNLDGTGVEDLITTGLNAPSGIALDVSGGKMYWVDRGTDKIQRSNLDGTGVEDLVKGVTDPRGMALDISGGKMYWVDNSSDKIQRANLDGGSIEDLVKGVTDPRGIALDISGGKMYWVDNSSDKIQRANLDGTDVEDVLTTGLQTPVSIVLDVK